MSTQPLADSQTLQTGNRGVGVLVLSAVVAALGSFLFGFDTAVISGATESLRQVFALNNNLLGFTVSSALIGTRLGLYQRVVQRIGWADDGCWQFWLYYF